MKRLAVMAACLAGLLVHGANPATALSASFHYKWPYRWDTSAVTTTYPYSGVHGCQPGGECVAAYDLVIANNFVASSSAGTAFVSGGFLQGECRSNGGYGNFVDIDGVRYAHLDSFALANGASVLQGDQVGVQGSTGYVIPCPGGVHLHWEFRSGTVPTIDGGSATSSNSVIGEYSTAGATLRAYYQAHGGWNGIGWTYKHCPGTCTLDMTANRSWGRMQDFQHDPDGFGGTFDTLHVANANPSQAYLVDSVFWLGGGRPGQQRRPAPARHGHG